MDLKELNIDQNVEWRYMGSNRYCEACGSKSFVVYGFCPPEYDYVWLRCANGCQNVAHGSSIIKVPKSCIY